MITENFHKMPSPGFVAAVVTFLISIAAFGLLKDFMVFILSRMYQFFIQHN